MIQNSIFHYDFIILESTEVVSQCRLFPSVTIGRRHYYYSKRSGLHNSSTCVRMRRLITRVTRVGISKTLKQYHVLSLVADNVSTKLCLNHPNNEVLAFNV